MENGVYKFYTELPTWAKGVLAVAIIGGTALVGYKIYQKIKNNELLKDSDKTANAADDEYKKLLKQGKVLSNNNLAYQSLSNFIAESLAGCELPSTEIAVINAIKNVVKSPIDWYYLVKVFGSKMIDDCGVLTGETAYALPELLKDQLGQGDYVGIPTGANFDKLQKYLKSIGVTI